MHKGIHDMISKKKTLTLKTHESTGTEGNRKWERGQGTTRTEGKSKNNKKQKLDGQVK